MSGEHKRRLGLGYRRTDLRRQLVEAVMRGEKTATASLRDQFAPNTNEPMPNVGERLVLVGWDDEPLAVVETTEVRVVPAGRVDLQFARDVGEGLRAWRTGAPRTSGSGPIERLPTTRSWSASGSG